MNNNKIKLNTYGTMIKYILYNKDSANILIYCITKTRIHDKCWILKIKVCDFWAGVYVHTRVWAKGNRGDLMSDGLSCNML